MQRQKNKKTKWSKKVFCSDKKYKVKEIFGPTIQGEGLFAGSVVKFLRLSGCNRWSGLPHDKPSSICSFCDTDFVGGTMMDAREIIRELEKIKADIVVISGGEPLLTLDANLCSQIAKYWRVHVESNGSILIDDKEIKHFIDHYCVSPKQSLNETYLSGVDAIKILYPEIDPLITIEEFDKAPVGHKFLQPVWNEFYEYNLKATIEKLKEHPHWRLSLQQHKIINVS